MKRFAVHAAIAAALMLGTAAFAAETTATATSSDKATSAAATEAKSATVKTLPSGIKYEDLVVGTGAEAVAGKKISVHYTGTLENGKKFDSSRDRNQPFQLTLGAGMVIKGWDEGLVGMKVGGKRKLTIPPDAAYGAAGRPPVIPPNSILIFDTELIDVR
jgi:FKBP-type peptidyl-prolyl cis-trans isomerase FkpA